VSGGKAEEILFGLIDETFHVTLIAMPSFPPEPRTYRTPSPTARDSQTEYCLQLPLTCHGGNYIFNYYGGNRF